MTVAAEKVTLHLGDCLEFMRTLPDDSIDSLVTDPPYELGFMGKAWDSTGIAYNVDVWREALRVLKPGGHLLAFGGSRTYHRLACAIEDAGFEIRDQIMWIYGSGFNKVGYIKNGDGTHAMPGWAGSLKPAHEPIVVARKPLIGTVAANVLAYGTGAINVDGCRVGTDPSIDDPRLGGKGKWKTDKAAKNVYEGGYAGRDIASSSMGRWPANVCHDGSDEVLEVFARAGERKSGRGIKSPAGNPKSTGKTMGAFVAKFDNPGAGGDTGSAARFFTHCPQDHPDAARFLYAPKASRRERNMGLEGMPEHKRTEANMTSRAEREGRAERQDATMQNHHPTVKPLALMRWLVRLVTPPGGTVLDPFVGSGTTGAAAKLEGFGFIGCEIAPDYFEIAQRRIAEAQMQPALLEEMASK